jgi:hypothetical protein
MAPLPHVIAVRIKTGGGLRQRNPPLLPPNPKLPPKLATRPAKTSG